MAAHIRSLFERERDLQLITAMYLDGKFQHEIAKIVGVSQVQVSRDLAEVKKRWLESSLRDFDELKSEELAKLDRLEVTYREAWVRSCKDKDRLMEEDSEKGNRVQIVTEGQSGNPAFLDGIHKCIMARCKILGLVDIKVKTELSGPDGKPIKVDMQVTVEERLKLADNILSKSNLGGDGAWQPVYSENPAPERSGVPGPL